MPTYEYRCKDCGDTFEVVQSFTDDPLTECPSVRRPAAQGVRHVGITFKGNGFYKTDSRSSCGRASSSEPQRATATSSSKSDERRPSSKSKTKTRRHRRSDSRSSRRSSRLDDARLPGVSADDRGLRRFGLLRVPRRRRPRSTSTRRTAPPSAPVTIGDVGDRRVAFLPRHGAGHDSRPTASTTGPTCGPCASSACTRILGPCAVGSLQPDVAPGDFVVRRPARRPHVGPAPTRSSTGPSASTTSRFADPYCPELRARGASSRPGARASPSTTAARSSSIQGPRFSTRAESPLVPRAGLGRHQHDAVPRGVLARELGICYAAHRARSPTTTPASRTIRGRAGDPGRGLRGHGGERRAWAGAGAVPGDLGGAGGP